MTAAAIPAAVVALLVWIIVEDLRLFRIRNIAVAGLVLLFGLDCLAGGRTALLLPHAIFAAVCFAGLAVVFALGAIGGGDAKLLTAALLWVGPEGCLVYALLLLSCTAIYVLGARFASWPARRRRSGLVIPFGPSIAASWLAFIPLLFWL